MPTRYRRYTNTRELTEKAHLVRQMRGRKQLYGTQGSVYDLEELFEDLNRRFFFGLMARPQLTWSNNHARRMLGHYDPAHNAIVISKIFDHPRIPRYAIEYLLYHEMLHLKHPVKLRGSRRCVHGQRVPGGGKALPGIGAGHGVSEAALAINAVKTVASGCDSGKMSLVSSPTTNQAPPSRKLRVLAVDDNEIHCYAMHKVLASAGFEVTSAHSGNEALQVIEQASSGRSTARHRTWRHGWVRSLQPDPRRVRRTIMWRSFSIRHRTCRCVAALNRRRVPMLSSPIRWIPSIWSRSCADASNVGATPLLRSNGNSTVTRAQNAAVPR